MPDRSQFDGPNRYKSSDAFHHGLSKDLAMMANFKFDTEYATVATGVTLTSSIATSLPMLFPMNTIDTTVISGTILRTFFDYHPPPGMDIQMTLRWGHWVTLASRIEVHVNLEHENYNIGEMGVSLVPLTATQAINSSLISPQPIVATSNWNTTPVAAQFAMANNMPRAKLHRINGFASGRTSTTIRGQQNMSTMNAEPYWISDLNHWENLVTAVNVNYRTYWKLTIFFLSPTDRPLSDTVRLQTTVRQTWWVHAFQPRPASLISEEALMLTETVRARVINEVEECQRKRKRIKLDQIEECEEVKEVEE